MSSPPAFVLRGGGAVIPGPVPGAVAIQASVGQGGKNRGEDTRAVQVALNAAPVAVGGAGESLAVDGLCGPLTIGAIQTFQAQWLTILDGRCDPAGPTLALLNAMAGVGDALPPGTTTTAAAVTSSVAARPAVAARRGPRVPSAAERARIQAAELRQFVVERHHQPIVFRALLTALRVVDAAERHVKRLRALPRGGKLPDAARNDPDRRAFLLVAKTFKLHESKVAAAAAAVRRVDAILRRSMIAVGHRLPSRGLGVSPAPAVDAPLFVSLFGIPANVGRADGYVPQLGGLHFTPGSSTGLTNAFVAPGRVVPEFRDRIYLPPAFDDSNPNNQRLIMMHELAHFSGDKSGSGRADDFATVFQTAKYRALTSELRLENADSYAFFTTECSVGTATALQDCHTDANTIPLFPLVIASFVQPEPDISLPPPGLPESDKFDFPAGFLF